MPAHFLTVLTRWVHILAMAALLGGSLLIWWLSTGWQPWQSEEESRLLLLAARRYEKLFWISTGLIVLTGIGNLGVFGSGLPAGNTAWGLKLILKLSFVLLLVVFSLFRSFFVSGLWLNEARVKPARTVRIARGLYAVTAMLAIAILFIAVFLAHG